LAEPLQPFSKSVSDTQTRGLAEHYIYISLVKKQTADKLINKEFDLEVKKRRVREERGKLLLSALGRPPVLVAGCWIGGQVPVIRPTLGIPLAGPRRNWWVRPGPREGE